MWLIGLFIYERIGYWIIYIEYGVWGDKGYLVVKNI